MGRDLKLIDQASQVSQNVALNSISVQNIETDFVAVGIITISIYWSLFSSTILKSVLFNFVPGSLGSLDHLFFNPCPVSFEKEKKREKTFFSPARCKNFLGERNCLAQIRSPLAQFWKMCSETKPNLWIKISCERLSLKLCTIFLFHFLQNSQVSCFLHRSSEPFLNGGLVEKFGSVWDTQ